MKQRVKRMGGHEKRIQQRKKKRKKAEGKKKSVQCSQGAWPIKIPSGAEGR